MDKKILLGSIITVVILILVPFSSAVDVGIERGNQPPYTPNNYYPCSEPEPVDVDVNLSWDGGDPDQGDSVTYSVYFGRTNPPTLDAIVGPYLWNQTRIQYDPGTLEYCED